MNNLSHQDINRLRDYQSRSLQLNHIKNDNNEFEIVSLDESISNPVNRSSSTLIDNTYEKKENLFKKILKTSINETEDNLYKNESTWSSVLSNKINNITNKLKYNLLTTNSSVNFYNLKYVKIFDKFFQREEIRTELFLNCIERIMHFTYRSNFYPIIHLTKFFTTDCGWGCMIRAAQMMLAKLILENKIYQFQKSNKSNHIEEEILNKFKYQTFLLFFDNKVNLKELKDCELESVITPDGYSILDDENIINPPFSIQNICKIGPIYNKYAGEWFSDVIMMNILSELNKQFKCLSNMEIIYFNDGIIDEETIFKSCFEQLKCKNECENKLNKILSTYKDARDSLPAQELCEECLKFYSEYYGVNSIITHSNSNKYFIFSKGGGLFTSVRLGLDSISKEYFEHIRNIYKIPFNLGIIGGKENSALYFIGESGDKLIYLDPHIDQNAIKDSQSLLINTNFDTYSAKYIYQTGLSNISPAFTIGFFFRSLSEYKLLIQSLINSQSKIFSFRSIHTANVKKKSSTNLELVADIDGESDDFTIINFK